MTLPVFWVPGLDAVAGGSVLVEGAEARHAVVVRRIRAGEQVVLTDGVGTRATCEVAATTKSTVQARVSELVRDREPVPRVTVVQAIPKGERAERTVEVLTEIGVDRIVPWAAARCVGVWRGERAARSLEKWRTTAREAAKQSRRSWFPEVVDPVDAEGVADLLAGADLAVVLHEEATDGPAALDLEGIGTIVVVVGPEGGIAPEELEHLAAARQVRLGPTVLRTSTAGLAAVAALLARTPRW